jgi:hypothetical protein
MPSPRPRGGRHRGEPRIVKIEGERASGTC